MRRPQLGDECIYQLERNGTLNLHTLYKNEKSEHGALRLNPLLQHRVRTGLNIMYATGNEEIATPVYDSLHVALLGARY